jgi:prephenate dehydrogenase
VSAMRTVVIGGAGQVGGLFARLLDPVVCVDERLVARAGESIVGDACRPPGAVLAAVRSADAVVFALPQAAALRAIPACAGAVRPGALLVETLSVKASVAPLLAEVVAARGVEACGLNPMFAPALGFAGNAVAATRVAGGPRTEWLLGAIRRAGARVVELSAAEHDRITAVLQAATHASVLAFGRVVVEHGADPGALVDLAPPPHLTMLALLARMSGGNPEVYWDIQAANPGAPAARTALAEAVRELDGLVRAGDRAGFAWWLRQVESYLGARSGELRDRCARIFTRSWTTPS